MADFQARLETDCVPRSQLYAQKRTKLDQDLRSTLVGNRLSMRTSATRRIGNETNGLSNVHNHVCLSTANSGHGNYNVTRQYPR